MMGNLKTDPGYRSESRYKI